jgi:hypothetical protein
VIKYLKEQKSVPLLERGKVWSGTHAHGSSVDFLVDSIRVEMCEHIYTSHIPLIQLSFGAFR